MGSLKRLTSNANGDKIRIAIITKARKKEMIIKVAEAKLSDKPKTIKVEMTEEEALIALTAIDTIREHYAEQLACPNRRTRRALKTGRISEKKMRETYHAARALKDKIAAGIVGANADELEAAIRAVREGKNE